MVCKISNPPLDLSTGALDQLIDTLLLSLLVPQSQIDLPGEYNVSYVTAKNIRVVQLDTIQRTCPVQLLTNDSFGCTSQGLLLKACFGAEQLKVELSLKSLMGTSGVGLFEENYDFSNKYDMTRIKLEARLFAPAEDSQLPKKRLLQIVSILTTSSGDLEIRPHQSSFTKSILKSMVKGSFKLLQDTIIDYLDKYVIGLLNDQVKQYHITPLFVTQGSDDTNNDDNRGLSKRSLAGVKRRSGRSRYLIAANNMVMN
ncbi:unnamed protein product [Echinostoma caproni]|uniref:Uncharacterized protein n=1 Tax=Echinostoma caproni TaxID=27848 RepID=A0A3P8KZS1_9TREM|nr:unnamed protein product [Echinostoma caproni]